MPQPQIDAPLTLGAQLEARAGHADLAGRVALRQLVRRLKQLHFDRRRLPEAALYWRRRGDRSFEPFTSEDYEALRQTFAAAERLNLVEA